MRILVCDSDARGTKQAVAWLSGWGYEVVSADGGIDAWRLLDRDDAPAVALLGWSTRGLSALEICRMLRSAPHGAAVYVIVIIGAEEEGTVDLIDAREAGVDDVLMKPIEPRELQFRVARGVAFREGRPRPRMASFPPASGNPSSIPPPSLGSSRPPRSMDAAAITLGGRYRLVRKLAEGRRTTVWLAVHLSLGINVAVRFMKAEATDHLDYAAFEADARAIEQVRSPHLARVYGHGSHEGLPYIAMEYLGGETLADHVARHGPMPMQNVAALVAQLSAGLVEAHAAGVVHRSVRPENVVLLPDPSWGPGFVAKLVDFGALLSALSPDETGEIRTQASSLSPECLKGEVAPNEALDVWGLGTVTFTAATGARPFHGDTFAQIYSRVCLDPLPLPSQLSSTLPAELDAWFQKACARDPHLRFRSVAELAGAFAAMRGPERTRSVVPRPSPR